MTKLHAAIVGFDITPEIHPEYGAWGTTPQLTKIDMPLLARCVALRQDKQLLIWFGSDLCGNPVPETDLLRSEVADALDLDASRSFGRPVKLIRAPRCPVRTCLAAAASRYGAPMIRRIALPSGRS